MRWPCVCRPWLLRLILSVHLVTVAIAATVTYDFNISWVTTNPDGVFQRPTIGINGQWPIPRIEANVGDRIIVHVHNGLGNQSTSLHFHGLFMNGSTQMDGAAQVSQCAIRPGSRFTYDFEVFQAGTYWYHSHFRGQYPDGLRGPMIIHDPESPFRDRYDEELVLTVSDWYHDEMQHLLPRFISKLNPTGAEPVPDSALLNETQNLKVPVKAGKTYLVRMINVGAFAGQYVWIEGHTLSIVEVDGVYTQPAEASMIYLSSAQRCSFLVTTRNDSSANFPIVASMDTVSAAESTAVVMSLTWDETLFDKVPDALNWNVTGWLVYDGDKHLPEPSLVDRLEPFDDMDLVPWDRQALLGEPDMNIELDVMMNNLGDGANYAFFNNITYLPPRVPTLYTALGSGSDATEARIYGTHTHTFVLASNQLVQIVVNNLDTGRHPFHLHGHHFQVVYRSPEEGGPFDAAKARYGSTPMRRDTVVVEPNGNLALRFRADNAGVWLFHCHLEWHVQSGLMATLVEAPLELQRSLRIPQDHLDACEAAGVPTAGNAAGNVRDWFDLEGEPSPPGPLPAGFTSRGIMALLFSCLSGMLGVAVVVWYGLAGLGEGESETGAHVAAGEPASDAPYSALPAQPRQLVVLGGEAART